MKLHHIFTKNLILIFGVLIPSISWACMPPFPSEIMIGRVDSLEKTTSGIIDIGFSSYAFPFRDFTYEAPTSWKYHSNDDYAISHVFPDDIQVDSLIIALSDTQDGRLPKDYSVFHILVGAMCLLEVGIVGFQKILKYPMLMLDGIGLNGSLKKSIHSGNDFGIRYIL